jgi:hypothetical protein
VSRAGTIRALLAPPADRARVVVGFVWVVAVPIALLNGLAALAAVGAVAAGLAGFEVGRAWAAAGAAVEPVLVALPAAAVTIAAANDSAAAGAVVVAATVVSVVAPAIATRRPATALDAAGRSIAGWLVPGLAGAGLACAHRWEVGSVVALLLLVTVYDLGLALVGHDGRAGEAVVAGSVGIVVVAFVVAMVPLPPFDPRSMVAFGALAVATIPLGPLVASWLLPAPDARAPVLRRLDTLLVVSPLWAWTVGLHVA